MSKQDVAYEDIGILSVNFKKEVKSMFIVGVDIAKRSHEAVVIDDSGNIIKKAFNFQNSTGGMKKFISILDSIGSDPSAFIVGMESTSHYWLALYSALKRKGYLIQVLNPI